jgi:hypothetical protein
MTLEQFIARWGTENASFWIRALLENPGAFVAGKGAGSERRKIVNDLADDLEKLCVGKG